MKNDAITGGPVNSSYGRSPPLRAMLTSVAYMHRVKNADAACCPGRRIACAMPRGSGNLARRMTRLAGHGLVRVSVLRRWEMTPAGWNLIRAVESEIREESAKSPGATIGA